MTSKINLKKTMKPLFFRTSIITLFAIVLQLNNACKKNNETTPENTCKLTQYTNTSTTATGTSNYTQTYDYNDKGLMSGSSGTSQNKDKSGNQLTTGSSSTSYQYDADGYLIKQLYQRQGTSKADGSTTESSTTDYQYQNGRLTKRTYTSTQTAKGKTTTDGYVFTYEYDAEGNNIKFSYTKSGAATSSAILYEWKDKKLTKITNIDGGTQTIPFIEVNANGYITKQINTDGRETRYTYDSEGSVIRQENWYGGKKTGAYEYEYDAQKDWGVLSDPVFKWLPKNNFNGLNLHNPTKYTYFNVDGSGQETIGSSTSYSYQYNTKGYPTGYSGNSTGGNVTNVVLTYKDCQ
jgi:YD repeat-containing protein